MAEIEEPGFIFARIPWLTFLLECGWVALRRSRLCGSLLFEILHRQDYQSHWRPPPWPL